jgi:hypothetical protein
MTVTIYYIYISILYYIIYIIISIVIEIKNRTTMIAITIQIENHIELG